MGWFWADPKPLFTASSPHQIPLHESASNPPPACPMHNKLPSASITPVAPTKAETACPYTPPSRDAAHENSSGASLLSKINPLNYMFSEISNERAKEQKILLELEREASTIPRGDGEGLWEYPSPQQMYNALLRKGYHDTDPTAVTAMVSVHNFLNEGAWKEIRVWEGLFSDGLVEGWKKTQRGEQGYVEAATAGEEPSLMRFQGRPTEMTPKAAFWQALGRVSAKFDTEPPFDRHDWYVQRKTKEGTKEVRYIIDYYAAPDDEHGNAVFNLDVRPALDSPILIMERAIRAGGDVWYKASGAAVRESY